MKFKKIDDYVNEVALKFPEIPESEIKKILKYGWKMILLYSNAGNDIYIHKGKFFFFIGKLTKDSLKNFKIYCDKLSKRIAFMFKRTKSTWDGYYYFARTEKQFQEYLAQSRKKKKVFKNVFLFKLLDQCSLFSPASQYIFRLSDSRTVRLLRYYPEIITDKAELIVQRDPLTMQDVMVSYNKYKYIQ